MQGGKEKKEYKMAERVNSCPLCGGRALLVSYTGIVRDIFDEINEDLFYNYEEEILDYREFKVRCTGCGISIPVLEDKSAAIERWNSLPAIPQQTAVIFKNKPSLYKEKQQSE